MNQKGIEHEEFQRWWRQQPEFRDHALMKIAWKAWKASKRNTEEVQKENQRQLDLDSY
jgi:hypothetical protein